MARVTAKPPANKPPANRNSADADDAAPGATVTALAPKATVAEANSPRSPLLSASLGLPGPGAAIKVGSVGVTLPSGYLYYGGLGVLAIAGAIEWPVAAAIRAGTFVVTRLFKRSPATAHEVTAAEDVTDAEGAATEEDSDQD